MIFLCKIRGRYAVFRIEEKRSMEYFKEIEIACISISGISKQSSEGQKYIEHVVTILDMLRPEPPFRANSVSGVSKAVLSESPFQAQP